MKVVALGGSVMSRMVWSLSDAYRRVGGGAAATANDALRAIFLSAVQRRLPHARGPWERAEWHVSTRVQNKSRGLQKEGPLARRQEVDDHLRDWL